MKQGNGEKRSLPGYLLLGIKGFCMGASDVVPGVSGGTMAFILGIYEELISAIRSFDLESLKLLLKFRFRPLMARLPWAFLLALGAGIFIAVFTLARVLSWLLQNEPVMIWSFFMGLILASVISVSRRVEDWRLTRWVCLAGGTAGAYFLVGIVPVSTPEAGWFLFLCGALAICAMILPGISGSFILVLLGKYHYVLEAVNNRDLMVLSVISAGAVLGIIVFSRVLGWLLKRWHDQMVALLTGLMLGSLRKIWPWKETMDSALDGRGNLVPLVQANVLPDRWDGDLLAAGLLMLTGFAVVVFLDRLGKRS